MVALTWGQLVALVALATLWWLPIGFYGGLWFARRRQAEVAPRRRRTDHVDTEC